MESDVHLIVVLYNITRYSHQEVSILDTSDTCLFALVENQSCDPFSCKQEIAH